MHTPPAHGHHALIPTTLALLAAVIIPLLASGCGGEVTVVGPPLVPPPIIAPGIGVVYYGGNPYYWDGERYSYWDGHGYHRFDNAGPGYDHRVYDDHGYDHQGYDRQGYRRPEEAPRPNDRGSRDAHPAHEHDEQHSG